MTLKSALKNIFSEIRNPEGALPPNPQGRYQKFEYALPYNLK
jgi:hypothetical protein